MFSKILIANRGEIAVRIIRACKEMGIATVAVYSKADEDSLHVALADECYCIGGAPAAESYLNQERIISTALVSKSQAIHPGYGFLSENADFAELCRKNDLVFIGPSAQTMRALSDKAKAKALMENAGLPTIPGTGVLESAREAKEAAGRMGYPVMLKARSGGGGRGIRLIETEAELERGFAAARAEGAAAFGDGAVYMEKFIGAARHVEFQILADEGGKVLCLGERDCSVQKNNQKLMEESPSPGVTAQQREKMISLCTAAIAKVGYTGVGTLEFLMDKEGQLYFMEMNTRLQVEHPVTEALTGIDLVKWQIRTAAGVMIRYEQADIDLSGCSIECRINALAPGQVEFLHVPGGAFVRFDTYLAGGTRVTSHYDPLLGKLIVYAGTREEALRKLKAALCELVIDGVPNNIESQVGILDREDFMDGSYDLNFFAKRGD